MYLARELTDSSLPAIGREFGGRDHTTVMYAVEKIKTRMAAQDEIYNAVGTLHGRLTERDVPGSGEYADTKS